MSTPILLARGETHSISLANNSDLVSATYSPCVLKYPAGTWGVSHELTGYDTHSAGWLIQIDDINQNITIKIPLAAKLGKYVGNVRSLVPQPPLIPNSLTILTETCYHIHFEVKAEEPIDFEWDGECFTYGEMDTQEALQFPRYLWWVNRKWIGRLTIPTDDTMYLTRVYKNGILKYCSPYDRQCIDDDNLGGFFVWDGTGYSALRDDIRTYINIMQVQNITQYLKLSSGKWIPQAIQPNSGDIYLQVSELTVAGNVIWRYTPAGATIPYNLSLRENQAIEYGGLDKWELREPAPTVFIWHPDFESFNVSKRYLKYRHGRIDLDLPSYLFYENNQWLGSTTVPVNKPTLVLDKTDSTFISYTKPVNTTMPYNPTPWAVRGIVEVDLLTWNKTCIDEPIIVGSGDCRNYCYSVADLLENFGIDATEIPPYLIWDDSCWVPSQTLTPGKPYMTVAITGGEVCFTIPPNVAIPYNPNADGQCALEPNSDGGWCPTSAPLALAFYDCSTDTLRINRAKLEYVNKLKTNNLGTVFNWNLSCWVPAANTSPGILKLTRSVGDENVVWTKSTGVPGLSSWPYDPRDWAKRSFRVTYSDLCPVAISAPILSWNAPKPAFYYDSDTQSFCYPWFLAKMQLGVTDASSFPAYLQWTGSQWQPKDTITGDPTYYLYKIAITEDDEISALCYRVPVGKTLPYNPNDDGKGSLIYSNSGNWTIDDVCLYCFCISLDYFKSVYGGNPSCDFPTYLKWNPDTECWTPQWLGNNPPDEPYLKLEITDTQACYSLVGELPEGYNIFEFSGIRIGGSYLEEWCIQPKPCAKMVWSNGCFRADREELTRNQGFELSSLPPRMIWNSQTNCWQAYWGTTLLASKPYLELSITATEIRYCKPSTVAMPYDPDSAYGPGRGINFCTNGTYCPIEIWPPSNPEDCPIIRFIGNAITRGKYNANGEFETCEPTNPDEGLGVMPDGTRWEQWVYYGKEGIQGFAVNDRNLHDRLRISAQKYPILWYKLGITEFNPQTSGNGIGQAGEKTFLSLGEWKNIPLGKANLFDVAIDGDLQFVILVEPNVKEIVKPTTIRFM